MVIEIINNQRVLTPDENMWLYNESQRVISDKVYLGVEADESDWSEITEQRKHELEAMWSEENLDENIATDKDYQSALESLGVNFDE